MLVQFLYILMHFSFFFAGISGEESDAVKSTNDFTATRGMAKVDRDSSCVPSTSSNVAKPSVVQSIFDSDL